MATARSRSRGGRVVARLLNGRGNFAPALLVGEKYVTQLEELANPEGSLGGGHLIGADEPEVVVAGPAHENLELAFVERRAVASGALLRLLADALRAVAAGECRQVVRPGDLAPGVVELANDGLAAPAVASGGSPGGGGRSGRGGGRDGGCGACAVVVVVVLCRRDGRSR
ncbi:hypothetical protein BDY21DRAFT_359228 [Lineolata rhizophorae]|uniref:Uncharacterized protein n=1 Tax=Lineolata rhizophorae TaxID=578093 RepID=A0A6A6NMI5_9PEZI|nr:hypothetical protein BDY21DRAFT_359228 [Lineolata rhizophorae]